MSQLTPGELGVMRLLWEHGEMKPAEIIRALDLKRPIYKRTASYGHFGRRLPEFTWEGTDVAASLAAAVGAAVPVAK